MSNPEATSTSVAATPKEQSTNLFYPLPHSRTGALVFASSALLWIAQAALLAWAVQRLANGGDWNAVVWPAAAYVTLGMARATGEAWGNRQIFTTARRYVSQVRGQTCAALACSSPMNRERPASGQAASGIAEQAEALLPWLLRYQPAYWRVMIVPPVIALVVFSLSWAAALILIAAAPLIPLAMALIGRRAKAASEEQLQALGGMNGFLLDRLRGLSTLRALGAVDATAHRLRDSAEALRQRTMRVLRIAFLSSAALELFSALAVALVAVYVGFHLLGQIGVGSWGRRLTLGEGLFVLLLAPAFFEPLRELSAVWHDKAAGLAALDALAALRRDGLPLLGALDDHTTAQAGLLPMPPSVDIQALCLTHPDGSAVFDRVALCIRAGEHVALIGPSGAGKTTLLSIIAGLIPVSSGEVRIGGIRLEERSAANLRRRMAWIGQKPHVFSGSVHDNIALYRQDVSRDDVATVLRNAGLGAATHIEPESRLGEGGMGLSGGEAVRLALARAAATARADLWLLDEPTAHLDRNTALAVVDSLRRMARGRTLIVATHDVALAARIGRIIDIGLLNATQANRRIA